ncbi:uncharacterized protein LOC120170222 isoform X1 [Hibiscus syriacus]|uniref:uncharacterized protein LOC120170222 isoform X1 n=1 Tax=Hibiscus syriacus TaxID=106335 RepID=UPI00192509FB|nr:uncharacterized protein LOC120170222 isoform X1 [Hibiscus syriacus]
MVELSEKWESLSLYKYAHSLCSNPKDIPFNRRLLFLPLPDFLSFIPSLVWQPISSVVEGSPAWGSAFLTAPPLSRPRPLLHLLLLSGSFRCAHSSAYDKNLDDQVHATVVPDDVIQPQSDKYWAPNPQTGVFGPAAEQLNASVGGEQGINSGGENSVLEEKAWFRPTSIEDLEKPHHH